MSNERTPFLQELIRYSSGATLLIPRIILDEESDPYRKYEPTRQALNHLKNDKDLVLKEKRIDNDFVVVEIGFRDDKKCQKH